MKKMLAVTTLLGLTMLLLSGPVLASATDYSAVIGFHVNLDKTKGEVQFIRIELNDGEWYQFESETPILVSMYESLALTAVATGREVQIHWHSGSSGLRIVDSIYLR